MSKVNPPLEIDFWFSPFYTSLMKNTGESFEKLVEILAILRGPKGCPWDQEQTHKDLNPLLLEEAYEVVESVDQENFKNLKEELGDLLVHILFHSQLANETKHFDVTDIVKSACEKLIRRHPHVFGDEKVKDTKEVLTNWEIIKQKEKKKESILEGLPKALPALVKAFRLGEKASRVGFDWPSSSGVLEKMEEELKELKEAISNNHQEHIEDELGDLFFTLANLARTLKIDPETALRKTTDRFIRRFQWLEKESALNQRKLQDLNPKEWEELWEKAKKVTT